MPSLTSLAWPVSGFSGLCRPSRPAADPSFHHHQTLLKANDRAALTGQAPYTPTFCVILGSYSASGASVSLLYVRKIAMLCDRLKVWHKLGVSFLSYCSPEL